MKTSQPNSLQKKQFTYYCLFLLLSMCPKYMRQPTYAKTCFTDTYSYKGYCPLDYQNTEVSSRCRHGPTALVEHLSDTSTWYKNVDCMRCNLPSDAAYSPRCYMETNFRECRVASRYQNMSINPLAAYKNVG